MRIGFDISQTGRLKAGCGFFSESLINALTWVDACNEYILYSDFGDNIWDPLNDTLFSTNLANFKMHKTENKTHAEAKIFWQTEARLLEKKLGDVDIIHANNFFCPPKMNHAKIIYTLYDLSFLQYPDYTTEQNRIICFDGVFKASLYADYIVAISHYSRQHFLEIFPHYPKERIGVIYPASRFNHSISYQTSLFQIKPGEFWLNVGTLEPRKNIKHLLTSYAKLKAENPHTYPLVLAGKLGWLKENIHTLINDLNLQNDVQLLGYVNNDQLQWLYQNCFCLVYPSLFEGFGLPLLEAMTFGKPIISSNVSSMPEIAGSAAILIDPHDDNELVSAMQTIYEEPDTREKLTQHSLEQAKQFSWTKSAHALLDIYQMVMN